jgi:hypothetical protein
MFSYKLVVIQKRVRGVDSIDLVQLPLGEDLGWLETPATGKQTLSAQHFIDTGNATAKLMFSVEDGGIGVSDLRTARENRIQARAILLYIVDGR